VAFFSFSSWLSAEWRQTTSRPVPSNPGLLETVWTLERPPFGPYDKIAVHRYRLLSPQSSALSPVFFYLPGTNMNGELALADEKHNLWLYLARRGADVYTLDYRTHFVPAAGVSDSSFMADWTFQAFLDDIAEAVAWAKKQSGATRVFLAGFSRGVSLAYLYAAGRWKEDLCGLVMLDGGLKNPRPKSGYDLEKARAALKNFASDVGGNLGWEKRQELMKAVLEGSPDAAKQLAQILYKAWRPGGLANAVEGYSDPRVLARLLIGYDRYYPSIQTPENAALADYEDHPALAYDDRLKEVNVPVLVFQSSGMGAQFILGGFYTATLLANQDVTLNLLEGYGHLDVIAGERAQAEVFEKVQQWLGKRTACH